MVRHHVVLGFGEERASTGKQLKEHDSELVNVGTRIHARAADLLWRHVGERAGRNTCLGFCRYAQNFRNAEIGDFGGVVRRYQYV